VAAASYEARRFGVNSAMPMSVALQRCPDAVVLRGDYSRYAEYSERVMSIFRDLTPLVEPLSIDEAFLDVSGARRLHGAPAEIAWTIRRRVNDETGLTCSIGVAASKYVAKVASSRAKPDGMLVVPAAETVAFLRPLPVSALWGVGRVTEQALLRRGLRTVGDVADMPADALTRAVGPSLATRLAHLANGVDPREVETRRIEKSIGHETTFQHDLVDHDEIARDRNWAVALLEGSAAIGIALLLFGKRLPDVFGNVDFVFHVDFIIPSSSGLINHACKSVACLLLWFHFPIAYSASYVRRYSVPFETTGEAVIGSSRLLRAAIVKFVTGSGLK
jgi:hypothetical protein